MKILFNSIGMAGYIFVILLIIQYVCLSFQLPFHILVCLPIYLSRSGIHNTHITSFVKGYLFLTCKSFRKSSIIGKVEAQNFSKMRLDICVSFNIFQGYYNQPISLFQICYLNSTVAKTFSKIIFLHLPSIACYNSSLNNSR